MSEHSEPKSVFDQTVERAETIEVAVGQDSEQIFVVTLAEAAV